MSRTIFNKTCIFIVLIVVTIGLTSLGMRLPVLPGCSSSSSKPKPRPRAIIQTQAKSLKHLSFTDSSQLALIDFFRFIPIQQIIGALSLTILMLIPLSRFNFQLSRAPPCPA